MREHLRPTDSIDPLDHAPKSESQPTPSTFGAFSAPLRKGKECKARSFFEIGLPRAVCYLQLVPSLVIVRKDKEPGRQRYSRAYLFSPLGYTRLVKQILVMTKRC